ncbi:MAG TPA: tetratricopeptide repeat protein, partial [Gemmataceae bacterium]|nr:tetratricopeptide repeat protein [Gemmataceae bacterium]
GGGNRPSFPDRPGIRPPIGDINRPGIGGGRPPIIDDGGGVFNRPNRPIGRPVRPPNRPIIINNRPININVIRPGSRPWFDYHFHPWFRGYWAWWRPAGWFVGGPSTGWLLARRGPTFVFSNPFFSHTTVVFNYSQPLPPPPADPVNDPRSLEIADAAVLTFDRARDAFARGDPRVALALVDSAIQQLPTDATLHEFRALCLFALRDYRQAAETLYVVLAAGPGWDWETMHALYGDAATYTDQLRALEAYQRANPRSPEASFVLAYHYLVLGHVDAAIRQLENVARLLPDSQLTAELLAAMRAEANGQPPAPG